MRARLLLLPPPLLFVLPLLASLRLHAIEPLPLAPPPLTAVASLVGSGLVVLGAAIVVSAVAMFIHRRTTIVPHRRARSLVTSGPFRWSRNPMYVALSTIYIGVSLLAGSGWSLLFLAVPLGLMQGVTIPAEERILHDVFGAEYRAYAARVRRWL